MHDIIQGSTSIKAWGSLQGCSFCCGSRPRFHRLLVAVVVVDVIAVVAGSRRSQLSLALGSVVVVVVIAVVAFSQTIAGAGSRLQSILSQMSLAVVACIRFRPGARFHPGVDIHQHTDHPLGPQLLLLSLSSSPSSLNRDARHRRGCRSRRLQSVPSSA